MNSINKNKTSSHDNYLLLFLFYISLTGCSENSLNRIDNSKNDVKSFIQANGELASSDTVMISPPSVKFQWQYKVTFLISEGTKVKEGQQLVSFDSSQLKQKLAIKQSELRTAVKSLENVKLTTKAEHAKQKLTLAEMIKNREKTLTKWKQSKILDGKLTVKKLHIEFQLAKNEAKRHQSILLKSKESNRTKQAIESSKIDRLEKEVEALKSGIKRMTIMAPKSGIVMYRGDHQGNKVSVGDTVWMGRQLIEISSLDKIIVKAMVLEAEAGKLKLEQKVEIILDALPEKIFLGKISRLGKVYRRKSREQAKIILDTEVTLDELDKELMRPGMAARIKIITTEKINAI